MIKPAIVIVAYNRPASLQRLLSGVEKAVYDCNDIPLVISIDYQETNQAVIALAESFVWEYGEKRIVTHTENLGLRQHVLKCGDLTKEFGAIIMLEDDLYVSPHYYKYTQEALAYYEGEAVIAGISLYNHKKNFNNQLPFEPLEGNSDVYFLQVASSWGQAWTRRQWESFRFWYAEHDVVDTRAPISNFVIGWPDSSWLKHFIHYLAVTQKYFVFPRSSYSTNFSDEGSNNNAGNTFYQVPMQVEKPIPRFEKLEESIAVYDSFFELSPKIFKQISPALADVDFEVDLNGMKALDKVKAPFLLTSKIGSQPIKQFGLLLKPKEQNVLSEIPGTALRLEAVKTLTSNGIFDNKTEIAIFDYLYGLIPSAVKFKNTLNILMKKIRRR